MARPFDARELEARSKACSCKFSVRPTSHRIRSTASVTRPRRVIAVFSPKGGVGTTTIATNVAVAQALKRPDRVVLVDLSSSSAAWRATSTSSRSRPSRRSSATRQRYAGRIPCAPALPRLPGCISVPGDTRRAELVTPKHIERIITNLLEGYESVVIDAGSMLDERSMLAIEAAETLILPVYPEISALRAVHTLLDYFNEVGSIVSKSTFVLNNMFARGRAPARSIEGRSARMLTDLPTTTRSSTSKARNRERASRSSSGHRSRRPPSDSSGLSVSAFGGEAMAAADAVAEEGRPHFRSCVATIRVSATDRLASSSMSLARIAPRR